MPTNAPIEMPPFPVGLLLTSAAATVGVAVTDGSATGGPVDTTATVGATDGTADGTADGSTDGTADGTANGTADGISDFSTGLTDGRIEGGSELLGLSWRGGAAFAGPACPPCTP